MKKTKQQKNKTNRHHKKVNKNKTNAIRKNNQRPAQRMATRSMDSINSGRWSDEEHNKFLQLYRKYGKDWSRYYQNGLTTRTKKQIVSHAQKYFQKLQRQKQKPSAKSKYCTRSRSENKYNLRKRKVVKRYKPQRSVKRNPRRKKQVIPEPQPQIESQRESQREPQREPQRKQIKQQYILQQQQGQEEAQAQKSQQIQQQQQPQQPNIPPRIKDNIIITYPPKDEQKDKK